MPFNPEAQEGKEQEPTEPEGVAEFKSLMTKLTQHPTYGSYASEVLKTFSPEPDSNWQHALRDRSFLPLAVSHVYIAFWDNLGSWYHEPPEDKRRQAFDKLYEALKNILHGSEVRLDTFQDEAGKLTEDARWYETDPPATIYQGSSVEKVLRPGLLYSNNRERQMKAIVKLKANK